MRPEGQPNNKKERALRMHRIGQVVKEMNHTQLHNAFYNVILGDGIESSSNKQYLEAFSKKTEKILSLPEKL